MTQPTAVVTGGSAGIGAAICGEFLAGGYRVINLSREAPERTDPRLETIRVDLADRDATHRVATELAARADVTTMVHNAGTIRAALLEEVELADLDYVNNLHVAAAIILAQAFLPAMKAAAFGRIVLIGSRAALGLQRRTSYASSKSAMSGLARTWALELGQHGITVNCVAPGPIASTGMFHEVVPDGSEKMHRLAEGIPVRRLGQPGDVARAVRFMAAAENGYITGQTLMVCGGSSVGSIAL